MSRLPIRLKLTIAFTLVMALVLAATGLFLYLRLRAELDHTLNQGLASRSADIAALVRQTDTGLRQAPGASPAGGPESSDFAQILDSRGRVFDATTGLTRRPLLNHAQLRRALQATTAFDVSRAPWSDEPARLLAAPVRAQGRDLVVVVGASLASREEALSSLLSLLLIGGPIALALAALAAYGVASAALRPVESMRARAATISTADLTQRLPLSRSRDELQRLGVTLNEMLARVEAGLARERSFAADASHELRTPLAMLRTELELIARDRPAGIELQKAVAAAIGDADRLSRLADDLLTLARADSDRLPLALRAVPVGELLAIAGRLAPGDVEIVRPAPAQCSPAPVVRADPRRVEQALANLIENARRHGRGPVQVSARVRGQSLELHVTDRGPGFPADFLPHAFERFARADAAHTTPGTGLGLAIVSAIAEMHGGAAHAANRKHGGADVWLSIPLGGVQERFRAARPPLRHDQEQPQANPPSAPPPRRADRARDRRVRILRHRQHER